MKKFIRYTSFFIGLIFILLSLLALSQKIAVQSTLKHNQEIQRIFDKTAKYINSLEKLPTHQELQNWINDQNDTSIAFNYLQYETNNDNFSSTMKIPKNEYVLSLWRGEWNEYYYSWKNKKSTVPSDESVYYLTGYVIGDFLIFFLIGLVFFKISSKLKRE